MRPRVVRVHMHRVNHERCFEGIPILKRALIDGNKRTAILVLCDLLRLSGYRLVPALSAPGNTELEEMILALAASRMIYSELVPC